MAPAWLAINGNKRSLTLDLQKPEAIDIVNQLAAHADVVMENFRPGVMDGSASATRRYPQSTRG